MRYSCKTHGVIPIVRHNFVIKPDVSETHTVLECATLCIKCLADGILSQAHEEFLQLGDHIEFSEHTMPKTQQGIDECVRNIFSTLCAKVDAIGQKIKPESFDSIVKELGSAGVIDPMNQRGTIAVKILYTNPDFAELLV